MIPFVKNLIITGLKQVLAVEPAFANEVLGYLETNAAPAVQTYLAGKAQPALVAALQKLQADLSAPVPGKVIPLPVATAPAASNGSGAASLSPPALPGNSTTPPPSVPPADASSSALGTDDAPRRGGA